MVNIYILATLNDKRAISVLRREVHIVKDLIANMLIRIDTIILEKIVIDVEAGKMTLRAYNKAIVPIIVKASSNRYEVKVLAIKKIIV